MKKNYIIVGDNNFWYGTFSAENQTEIDSAMNEVLENMANFHTIDNMSYPSQIYCYEVNLISEKKAK